jgi:hypothetical protein
MFIQIEIDTVAIPAPLCAGIASICPVDIFSAVAGRLFLRPEQVDECLLCELCLDLAPPAAIAISRTYSNQKLLSRGSTRGSDTAIKDS